MRFSIGSRASRSRVVPGCPGGGGEGGCGVVATLAKCIRTNRSVCSAGTEPQQRVVSPYESTRIAGVKYRTPNVPRFEVGSLCGYGRQKGSPPFYELDRKRKRRMNDNGRSTTVRRHCGHARVFCMFALGRYSSSNRNIIFFFFFMGDENLSSILTGSSFVCKPRDQRLHVGYCFSKTVRAGFDRGF